MKNFVKALMIIFLCVSTLNVCSQNLARKGFLGISATPDVKNGQSLVIRQLIPNSTAEQLGLQQGDIIEIINKEKILSLQSFLELASQLTEGEAIQFTIRRKGKIKKLSGRVNPRPLPFSSDITYKLSSFPYKSGQVRAVLLETQIKDSLKGTIYFIQGYPCFSMAYLPKEDSYVSAMEAFVNKGYRVFFIEKSGMGDSYAEKGCNEIGFNDELELFNKGYEHLHGQIPNEINIILFGHSLGGIIAPILASRFNPKAVIVYGTVLKSWHDYLLDLLREQEPLKGMDYAAAEDSLRLYRPILFDFFVLNKSPEEINKINPLNEQRLKSSLLYDGKDQIMGRHYTYWQELNQYNMAAFWKEVKCPVLSVFGEADIAALKPEDMQRISEIINHYHPGNGTYYFAPLTNHDMVKTGTMQENLKVQFSKEYYFVQKEKFNYQLIDQISKWITTLKQ